MVKRLLYYIIYSLLWIITLLPLSILYILSDFAFILIYHVIRYRREVVATNLINSFPDKTEEELATIERKFYHHFCDIFLEASKLTHWSEKQITKRMKMVNPEEFQKLYDANKDAFIMLGHYGNWELLTAIPIFALKHKSVSIYKPLTSAVFDRLMNSLRSSTGAKMVSSSQILREIISNRNNNTRALYLSIADQTPVVNEIKYWTTFMNQDTPVITGTEKLAIKYDIHVYFLSIKKIKRGYYTFEVEPLFTNLQGLPEYAITESYTRKLEQLINNRPELYLWSHRRWKHKRNVETKSIDG